MQSTIPVPARHICAGCRERVVSGVPFPSLTSQVRFTPRGFHVQTPPISSCESTVGLFHGRYTEAGACTHLSLCVYSKQCFVGGASFPQRCEVRPFISQKHEQIRLRELPLPSYPHLNKTNTRLIIKDVAKALSIVFSSHLRRRVALHYGPKPSLVCS